MTDKIVEEIYQEIHRQNSLMGMKAVPHSDEFMKFITASMAIDLDLARRVIKILLASHKIFSMEIIAEDKTRDIPRVEGYVVSDLNLIRKLKNYYQSELMIEYEKQFQKRYLIHQIVREILPIMRSLNNTIVGQLANKAIMLEEFERLLEKNFTEYTPEWKEQHLAIELSKANLGQQREKRHSAPDAAERVKSARGEKGAGRAVDAKQYEEYISRSKSYPLQRVLKIYGIGFFLQINLRKYQFSYLRKLIEDGQIARRSDLTMLKDMIQTVKANIDKDPQLGDYIEDLNELERAVIHRIYFSGKDFISGS
jgi:hypothetical protein